MFVLYQRLFFLFHLMILNARANDIFSTYSVTSSKKCDGRQNIRLWTQIGRSKMRCVHHCAIDVRCEFVCFNMINGTCNGFSNNPTDPAQVDSKVEDSEWTSFWKKFPPSDCTDYFNEGWRTSEVYRIYPASPDRMISFEVFCEMKLFNGGLTVFQYRHDGSEDFYRNWNDYKNGFGDLHGEFWLGNDNLHQLTMYEKQRLYIVMTDAGGVTRYVSYDNFVIEDESMDYTIRIGAFSGTDVDKFRAGPKWNVDGMPFSTKDVDNDLRSGASCAVQFTGAWWYNDCMTSNLNGQYYTTCSSMPTHDKNCNYWSGTGPMRMTKMMVRRM